MVTVSVLTDPKQHLQVAAIILHLEVQIIQDNACSSEPKDIKADWHAQIIMVIASLQKLDLHY